VFHVAARALATQALSIFGDHSDVMAVRATGFAMLASNSVQEVMDMALIAQAASARIAPALPPLLRRLPHFARSRQGRAAHGDDMRAMIDDDLVRAHRARALNPRPARASRHGAESRRLLPGARGLPIPFTTPAPTIVQNAMDRFAALTGRQYRLFDYVGAPDAERVIVLMGSGAEVAAGDVDRLWRAARRSAC
jgi:pyruvate-ferredoxin/flavodoxin oxidoreductase